MTEIKSELSHDLIMRAFQKIDELVKSNSELSSGINQLNFIINDLRSNWKDLKEELQQIRHDSKDAILSIEALYKTIDRRIDTLEKERELREILEEEAIKRNDKRFRYVKIFGVSFIGLFTSLHIPWKKFLEYISNPAGL